MPLPLLCREIIKVENLRFSPFSYIFYLLFPFSTLTVHLYAYRVEEQKFPLKLPLPRLRHFGVNFRFPPSPYPCTASVRRTKISPQNLFAAASAKWANLTSLVRSTNFTETGFPEAKHELWGFAVQLHFRVSENFTKFSFVPTNAVLAKKRGQRV